MSYEENSMAKAVLLDSGFLIRLMNPEEPLHPVAMQWFRQFVEQGVVCKVSTIALAEYGVKDDLTHLPMQYLQVLPFHYNHAERAARFMRTILKVKRKKELTPREVEEAAEKGKPFINYPHLHRQVWSREYFRALAKHSETKFKGDYMQIPRGRVAWTIDKFIVLVGHWAEPIQEELTTLIEQAFALPYFEFVYDEHWDLGHGWSGDMPTSR